VIRNVYMCRLHEYCIENILATQKWGSLSVMKSLLQKEIRQILVFRTRVYVFGPDSNHLLLFIS